MCCDGAPRSVFNPSQHPCGAARRAKTTQLVSFTTIYHRDLDLLDLLLWGSRGSAHAADLKRTLRHSLGVSCFFVVFVFAHLLQIPPCFLHAFLSTFKNVYNNLKEMLFRMKISSRILNSCLFVKFGVYMHLCTNFLIPRWYIKQMWMEVCRNV